MHCHTSSVCYILLNPIIGWFQYKSFMKSQKSNRRRPLAQCQACCKCPISWDGRELLCSMHRRCHIWCFDFINILSLLFCWWVLEMKSGGRWKVPHRSSRAIVADKPPPPRPLVPLSFPHMV
jgi:hypothetical protein